MHKFYIESMATSVNNDFIANTFSGQAVSSLWQTSAQAGHLSTAAGYWLVGLWQTLVGSTQQATRFYTARPLLLTVNSPLLHGQLSPLSTGPIKRLNKIYKEKGVS